MNNSIISHPRKHAKSGYMWELTKNRMGKGSDNMTKSINIVKRFANKGETILYTGHTSHVATYGESYEVDNVYKGDVQTTCGKSINPVSYSVIESENAKFDRELINAEHIIELSKTVAKLQRQLDVHSKDIATVDYKAGQALTTSSQIPELREHVEMLTDDIVSLDERTQPLTDNGAEEFTEGLADVIEAYVSEQLTRDQIRRSYE